MDSGHRIDGTYIKQMTHLPRRYLWSIYKPIIPMATIFLWLNQGFAAHPAMKNFVCWV